MAGMDRQARGTVEWPDDAVDIGGALERTGRRRADGDDTPARGARGVHRLGGRRGDDRVLGRHRMLFDARALDRSKGSRPDVQRHPMHVDAARAESREQPIAEMQPGRRRGDGARSARVDGLIPLDVLRSGLRVTDDVGWQRRDAVRTDHLVDRTVQPFDDAEAVGLDASDA